MKDTDSRIHCHTRSPRAGAAASRQAAVFGALQALALLAGLALGPALAQGPADAGAGVVELKLQPDEAEAALAILDLRARGLEVPESAWARLFASEGYRRMMARERFMDEQLGIDRGYSDEGHRTFFSTDTVLLGRLDALHEALDVWKQVDIARAGRRALAYLPAGTRIHGTIYPLLRNATNSFVFELGSDNPAIFMYMEPGKTAVSLENTLAHEFHHVGTGAGCPSRPEPKNERVAAFQSWLTGLGEGIAMLAAAGSPDADPEAGAPEELRRAWAIRQDSVVTDLVALTGFFRAILSGEIQGGALNRAGFDFINREGFPQGPFYTLGWFMAATVERELGRSAVVASVCSPGRLLVSYNRAAGGVNARRPDADLPLWPADLLEAIGSS